MQNYLFISIGAILGACSRYFLQSLFTNSIWHIWSVNLIGSFLGGCCFVFLQKNFQNTNLQLFLTTGFLGSFTTFSALSMIGFELLNESVIKGCFFILTQIILGVIVFYLGVHLYKTVSSFF